MSGVAARRALLVPLNGEQIDALSKLALEAAIEPGEAA